MSWWTTWSGYRRTSCYGNVPLDHTRVTPRQQVLCALNDIAGVTTSSTVLTRKMRTRNTAVSNILSFELTVTFWNIQELICCWDRRANVHKWNSERGGGSVVGQFLWKLKEKRASAVMNHITPNIGIFGLHFCSRLPGRSFSSFNIVGAESYTALGEMTRNNGHHCVRLQLFNLSLSK